MIILAIPMGIVAIAIKIENPGTAIFKQKRVGIHKSYFTLYKFRSMKVATPDIPTHLLENPEQYITKVGKFIRKTSIDELPQMWNIFKGDMSIIGPRPALWNQDDLVAERDKYGANDVKPGLTGWAQINGRDELEIPVKAKLDGDYVKRMGFGMDLRCFFGSIFAVLREDGVAEGGVLVR
ncbi:MAG: sugar transferase [Lachnospiraceae bacterium]|nr:sugar transferase [Lachnospiraceae bacterium]